MQEEKNPKEELDLGINSNNAYTKMQKDWYNQNSDMMNLGNHSGHNDNPDYWNILLSNLVDKNIEWKGKRALDFGCGCGRNIINLAGLADWAEISGCDISENNIKHTEENLIHVGIDNYSLYVNNGVGLDGIPENYYDFVMSTIVLEHICVWEIRFNILKGIYKVLREGGLFSFQMGYDPKYEMLDRNRFNDYYVNRYNAIGTNSKCDTIISNPDSEIVADLKEIGFKNISYKISNAYSSGHQYWIFIKCYK